MDKMKVRLLIFAVALLLLLAINSSITSAQEVSALPPLKIIQLGDSYSAGNGARSISGEKNYYSVDGCYRSPTNWGSQFAESLKGSYAVTYINRACSGGIVANITNPRDMKDVRLKDLNGNCPLPEFPDEEEWRASTFTCARWINPQIAAIDESVDLVLMTIGGNDLGFSSIVQNCFSVLRTPGTCRISVEDARAKISDPNELKNRLITTFATLKDKMRDGAKIAYVSYPNLLIDMPYLLEMWNGPVLLDRYDAGNEIRALSIEGEALQRAAVE